MSAMPTRKKEWVLTRDALDALLARFDESLDRAAEEYELTRARLVRLFRYRGCSSPYELADETVDRVARKVAEGEEIPRHELQNYFYGVARNVLREHLRNPAAFALPIDELPHSEHPSEDPDESSEADQAQQESERRLRCLEGCLRNVPADTRRLIISYYEGEEGAKIKNRRSLADGLGISVNSLRIRLHRTRQKLEQCVSECMKYENDA